MASFILRIQSKNNKKHWAILTMTQEATLYFLVEQRWVSTTPNSIGDRGKGAWDYKRPKVKAHLAELRHTMLILYGWWPSNHYVGQQGEGFHLKSGRRIPYGEVVWKIMDIGK